MMMYLITAAGIIFLLSTQLANAEYYRYYTAMKYNTAIDNLKTNYTSFNLADFLHWNTKLQNELKAHNPNMSVTNDPEILNLTKIPIPPMMIPNTPSSSQQQIPSPPTNANTTVITIQQQGPQLPSEENMTSSSSVSNSSVIPTTNITK